MADNIKYYVVKQKALPEVLLKVAEANRIIETENISVADATEKEQDCHSGSADICRWLCKIDSLHVEE